MNEEKLEIILNSLRDTPESQPNHNSFIRLMNSLPVTPVTPVRISKARPWYIMLSVGLVPALLVLGALFIDLRHTNSTTNVTPATTAVNTAITTTAVDGDLSEELADETGGMDLDDTLSTDVVSTETSELL